MAESGGFSGASRGVDRLPFSGGIEKQEECVHAQREKSMDGEIERIRRE
jgi:hypothetical protein